MAATIATGAAHAADADSVLHANQAAVGAVPANGTLHLTYAYAGQGLTGTTDAVSDLATGAYVDSWDIDPITGAAGYDGKTPWQRDFSGANTAQEGGDRIPAAVNEAYRDANLWWRPDHGGATIRYAGVETIDGAPTDHLVVTPKNGKRFDAWFDSKTHLLTRIAEDRQFFHTRAFFSDYRPENGVLLPHKIVQDGGTGEKNYETYTLQSAMVGAAQPLLAYALPATPPGGVTIDGGVASVTVPFQLLNNHIYIHGTVEGKGPYTFIVDTGGHTIVSPRVVQDAGLRSKGEAAATGVGKKVEVSGFARVHDIAIGGVHLRDQTAIAQPVYDAAVEGIAVDGMVGFELIDRLVTRIDYGTQTITFTDPAHFDPAGAGEALPFKFYDHLPQVAGRFGDQPGIFDIDTGSRSEVDITSPTVERLNLHQVYPHSVVAMTGWGVGGPVQSAVVRLPSLTLGDITSPNVVAGLEAPESGSMSDPNFEGNVGSAFLKRFVVTFDYGHQIMYLKPIVPPSADIGTFDRSGMWINAGAGGFVVMKVNDGGAAAQAGLQKDDVIVAIDGQKADPGQLSAARALLRMRPAGAKVAFDVRRGASNKTIEVTLRDQI